MRAMIDTETNGLEHTCLWCVSTIDLDTSKERFFGPDQIPEFEEWAKDVTLWSGHNFLSFDWEVIEKYTKVRIPFEEIEDTLILSRLAFAGVYKIHSLDAWGKRLGSLKVKHEDWSKYTEEMKERCIQDTRLTIKVRDTCLLKLKGFSSKCVELEHQTQIILNKQSKHGFGLDIDKARELFENCLTRSRILEVKIQEDFPPRNILVEVYTPRKNKDGTFNKMSINKINKKIHKYLSNGDVELYVEQIFNPASPKQVIERLDEAGWKPFILTPTGQAKLCEENYATLPDTAPAASHKLIEWKMLANRMAVLNGWFKAYNPETKRIHGEVIGVGAITHRMAHFNPQMANIPSIKSEYGKEFRSCFGVGDDLNYVQLGVDISGIQLCILAHYLDDKEYTKAIATGVKEKGTDIHSLNMRILQEIVPMADRDTAKKFIYSMLLGGGGAKLGFDMKTSTKNGHACKKLLFSRIPAFKRVKKMCSMAAKRGYMVGLDGRRALIKSEHFALSVYLQCGEAIIMKQALLYIDQRAKNLDWGQMAVVHDEVQSRVLKEQAEELGMLQIQAIVDAGELFKLRCPLTGEYSIGRNWSETH